MKIRCILIFFVMVQSCFLHAQSINIDDIRKDYAKAVEDKVLCEKWYQKFVSTTISSNKLKAYKGAITISMARFVVVAKKTPLVVQGKKLIEEAVAKEPNDVEIRFLRYSIQVHLPPALAYNKNIKEDRIFINAHLDKLPNEAMKIAVKKQMEETKNK